MKQHDTHFSSLDFNPGLVAESAYNAQSAQFDLVMLPSRRSY